MFAWQFQKALHVAEKYGWTRFVSMQDHLNVIYREEEREMLPLCREEKIGVIPYSPLASRRLTRDWSPERTHRSETDQIARIQEEVAYLERAQVVKFPMIMLTNSRTYERSLVVTPPRRDRERAGEIAPLGPSGICVRARKPMMFAFRFPPFLTFPRRHRRLSMIQRKPDP
jgi:hypothetical protein